MSYFHKFQWHKYLLCESFQKDVLIVCLNEIGRIFICVCVCVSRKLSMRIALHRMSELLIHIDVKIKLSFSMAITWIPAPLSSSLRCIEISNRNNNVHSEISNPRCVLHAQVIQTFWYYKTIENCNGNKQTKVDIFFRLWSSW